MLDKAQILIVTDGVEKVLFVHPFGVPAMTASPSSSAALA
jgi:hypothetical protein